MTQTILTILLAASIVTTVIYGTKLALSQNWQTKYYYTDRTMDWLLVSTIIGALLALSHLLPT